MQWASSTTSSPVAAESFGRTLSRKSGLLSRSGLTSRTSTSPAATWAWTSSHSSGLAELMVRAEIPARAAASTWLRMRASSGETITVGPAPRARSSAVATKYTADLPQPVRCTTSARRPSETSASMASHWSSRSRAEPVGSPTSRARTESAVVRSSSLLMASMQPDGSDKPRTGPAACGQPSRCGQPGTCGQLRHPALSTGSSGLAGTRRESAA